MNKEYFLSKVKKFNPTAFKTNDYNLVPEEFQVHSKIPINCLKHGIFHQRAYGHMQGRGCSQCARDKYGNGRQLVTEEFIANSKKRFEDKFSYEKTVYVNKSTELTITCDIHGDIIITPDHHRRLKYGCMKCDVEIPRAKKKQIILNKAREIHGEKFDYSRVVFTKDTDKVEIVCPSHGPFWQSLFHHTYFKNDCPACARTADNLSFDEFVQRARSIHGNQYTYRKDKYKNASSMTLITCQKHGDFAQRAHSHLEGSRCRLCYIEASWTTKEEFIKKSIEVHNDRYDYSKVLYRGSKVKVEIVCKIHGSFWQKPNSHVSNANGCWTCMESKGERAVDDVLKKYGINFVREYKIPPHLYRYDFYLPDLNVLIEFHGKQHYEPVEIFGGQEQYLDTVRRDKAKIKLAKEAGIKLIILTYLNLSGCSVEKELLQRLKLS